MTDFWLEIPPLLETDRLLLRPFYASDNESDYKLSKYRGITIKNKLPQYTQHDDSGSMFEMPVGSQNSQNFAYALSITNKNDGQFIGALGLNPNTLNGEVEFYCTLLPAYRGNGFATEAIMELFRFVFENTDINKLIANISGASKDSLRLASKLGMKETTGAIIQNEIRKFELKRNLYYSLLSQRD